MPDYDQTAPQEGRVSGLMLATVLSNEDDENKGCLKIQLACEGEQTSIFEGVKMLAPSAGESYGAYLLPEVGEQVLAGFLDGSIDRPVVLGSLYSRKDSMLSESYKEKNAVKRLKTKGGSLIEISDEKDGEYISLKTPKKLVLEMKQKDEKITLTTGESFLAIDGKGGKVQIKGKQEISLECGSASITLKSDGSITLKGNNLTVQGSGVKLDSKGTLDMKGQKSSLGGSMVEVNSQGILTLKGSMTKIN